MDVAWGFLHRLLEFFVAVGHLAEAESARPEEFDVGETLGRLDEVEDAFPGLHLAAAEDGEFLGIDPVFLLALKDFLLA